MKKIFLNSLFIFIVFLIGTLSMILLNGEYILLNNLELVIVLITLMYFISLICSIIKFLLFDKSN